MLLILIEKYTKPVGYWGSKWGTWISFFAAESEQSTKLLEKSSLIRTRHLLTDSPTILPDRASAESGVMQPCCFNSIAEDYPYTCT